MAAIKVAVVGVGSLGEHHARIYSELPEADLASVVDTDEERVHRAASLYKCRPVERHEEILNEVDAVSLAVPTSAHARVGVDCLHAGVHVLVEKPIAQSVEEAEQLIQARTRNDAILFVGHSERFNPALKAVKPHITHPRFFEAHRLSRFVPRSLDIDVVLDLMIHDLDLIRHLVDSPIRDIRAVGIPVLTPQTDIANARLEFENGCVANITASRVSKERVRKLRFFQPLEYVSLDFAQQDVEMYSLIERNSRREIVERKFELDPTPPLKAEIQAFLQAVKGDEPEEKFAALCSGEEGKSALSLALEIKNAIERRAVES